VAVPALHLHNRLLARLPEEDLAAIESHLRPVRLNAEFTLHNAGDLVDQAVFPHDAAIVLGVALDGVDLVATATVGGDGVVGGFAALDGQPESSHARVQIAGMASAIAIRDLRTIAENNPAIRTMLFRHQRFLLSQVQQAVACSASHTLAQRMAACLLRFRDVSGKTSLPVTQERIGELLAVKRTSVCLIAQRMQQTGIVKIRRGNIEVLNADGLRAESCDCYQKMRSQYRALFPDRAEELSPGGLVEPDMPQISA